MFHCSTIQSSPLPVHAMGPVLLPLWEALLALTFCSHVQDGVSSCYSILGMSWNQCLCRYKKSQGAKSDE